jgi:hypothetical protein
MVARGRIELPTQRFSVFRSTTELPGHEIFSLSSRSAELPDHKLNDEILKEKNKPRKKYLHFLRHLDS